MQVENTVNDEIVDNVQTEESVDIIEESSEVVSQSEFTSVDFITSLVEGNNVSADEMMQAMIRSEVEKQVNEFVKTVAESAFKPE